MLTHAIRAMRHQRGRPARYDAGAFNHAEIDVMGTVGVNSALAGSDQQKLIDWAIAKWGV